MGTIAPLIIIWADNLWLALLICAWIVAFFHHPPYSHGSHDSDDPLDSLGAKDVDWFDE